MRYFFNRQSRERIFSALQFVYFAEKTIRAAVSTDRSKFSFAAPIDQQ